MFMSLSFQENVMIVDSPGVGESEVMDESVVSYMSNAFCFMYVINTFNAGGVQKDRVRIIVYVSIVLKPQTHLWKTLRTLPSLLCYLLVVNSSTKQWRIQGRGPGGRGFPSCFWTKLRPEKVFLGDRLPLISRSGSCTA